MDEIRCTKCNWVGTTEDLVGIRCPECGQGKYIEDVHKEDEPLWKYFGGYNWNRE